ncbi:maturase [Bacteroidia bacterium]|nr:maturase [Bacteroidia bacterium]
MKQSKVSGYKFERLYRILFNEEMFYVAYQRIYAKAGNMTKGSDGKTADQMSILRIEHLIEKLRDESYQPHPSRRTYIPKKNGKKRPLGIPSFDDKLVQQVIKMILEAIYEESFEPTSHGFRPRKSCQTALIGIQRTFTGTKWFIEGDIKGFFDNISHEVLINALKERIADERFIRLIRKFLNAGYVEDWTYNKTYSGTPQGGIISPILANIYLDKFDKYMSEYIQNFNTGGRRRKHPQTSRLNDKKYKLALKLKTLNDENAKAKIADEIRSISKQQLMYPHSDHMDASIKRLKYIRYADDFLIGLIGSKADCAQIKEDIANYMSNTLKLELSAEKTLITNAQRPAKFLGYDIYIHNSNVTKRNKLGYLVRTFNNKIILHVTTETMRNKLMEYGAVKFDCRTGKEIWKSKAREYLMNDSLLDIITRYNAEIRGLYNYYAIANNSSSLNTFSSVMEYSMYKTYAGKLQCSVSKAIDKFYKNKKFAIPYTTSKGEPKLRIFYNGGFKRQEKADVLYQDNLPQIYTRTEPTLIQRLKACKCELCGATTNETVMLQVRTLKELKGTSDWENKMLKKHRKTLVLCKDCNDKAHQN